MEWGLCGAHGLYLTYLCPKSLPALTFYNYLHPPPKSTGKYARFLSALTLCSPHPSSSTGATHIHWPCLFHQGSLAFYRGSGEDRGESGRSRAQAPGIDSHCWKMTNSNKNRESPQRCSSPSSSGQTGVPGTMGKATQPVRARAETRRQALDSQSPPAPPPKIAFAQ